MTQHTVFQLYALVHACLQLQNVAVIRSESCPQSIPTRAVVAWCPEDRHAWEEAEKEKQCQLVIHNCTKKGQLQKLQYHCLPNKELDMLVEVCAISTIIVGRHCPYYDMKRNLIDPNFNQPCSSHSKPCANVYNSSEAYKYQECYKEINKGNGKPDSSKSNLSLESLTSYPELAIGLYTACALLGVVVILLTICLLKKKKEMMSCPCYQQENKSAGNTESSKLTDGLTTNGHPCNC